VTNLTSIGVAWPSRLRLLSESGHRVRIRTEEVEMTLRKLLASALVAAGIVVGIGATPAQAIKLPLLPALVDVALPNGIAPFDEVGLNPQPEPPSAVIHAIHGVGSLVQAGPQPEPPTKLGGPVSVLERVGLNPQPEPPSLEG
jgi:hypothetical protein